MSVCVIIAAYNAELTIKESICSALEANLVSEVIVVDDASTDKTLSIAQNIAAMDDRCHIISQNVNKGPSTARNIAIMRSKSDFIAILDSDDLLIKNRFLVLTSLNNWDMAADNIAFVSKSSAQSFIPTQPPYPKIFSLNLHDFVLGNLSSKKAERSELGFLKPIIKRQFLLNNKLFYNENLRLGEDYDLYVRMLSVGARFKQTTYVGYIAKIRGESLSGQHKTQDLKNLIEVSKSHLDLLGLSLKSKKAIAQHINFTKKKWEFREFLDIKKKLGFLSAIKFLFECRERLLFVLIKVIIKKSKFFLKKEIRSYPSVLIPFDKK